MSNKSTKDGIITVWNSLKDSKYWSEVEWISQCTSRPEWVLLGSHTTGELFALLDTKQRRVIDDEEVDMREIDALEWEGV